MQAWLLDERSDLLCSLLPPTVRDEEAYPAALALGAGGTLLAVLGCLRCWWRITKNHLDPGANVRDDDLDVGVHPSLIAG